MTHASQSDASNEMNASNDVKISHASDASDASDANASDVRLIENDQNESLTNVRLLNAQSLANDSNNYLQV